MVPIDKCDWIYENLTQLRNPKFIVQVIDGNEQNTHIAIF